MPHPGTALEKLGFLTIGLFDGQDPGPGHQYALEMIKLAERLGFDSAWLRCRHLQYGISSPVALLAAAQRRIEVGTAVIPVDWENPARLAEDLAAVVGGAEVGRAEVGGAGGQRCRSRWRAIHGRASLGGGDCAAAEQADLRRGRAHRPADGEAAADPRPRPASASSQWTPVSSPTASSSWRSPPPGHLPGKIARAVKGPRSGLPAANATLAHHTWEEFLADRKAAVG